LFPGKQAEVEDFFFAPLPTTKLHMDFFNIDKNENISSNFGFKESMPTILKIEDLCFRIETKRKQESPHRTSARYTNQISSPIGLLSMSGARALGISKNSSSSYFEVNSN